MRLLTLVAPGGEEARRRVSEALAAWNRGLDIRLRFLNLVVEESVRVLPEAAPGADALAGALGGAEEAVLREAPAVVLLHGRGPAAVAAALAVVKAGLPLVRSAAGRRDGRGADEERAADRLCAARLAEEDGDLGALAAEGLAGVPFSPEAALRAVMRLQRET